MGEVTIAFTFAPASVCVASVAGTEAEVRATTNPANAATTSQINAAMNTRNESYSLSNLKMSM